MKPFGKLCDSITAILGIVDWTQLQFSETGSFERVRIWCLGGMKYDSCQNWYHILTLPKKIGPKNVLIIPFLYSNKKQINFKLTNPIWLCDRVYQGGGQNGKSKETSVN